MVQIIHLVYKVIFYSTSSIILSAKPIQQAASYLVLNHKRKLDRIKNSHCAKKYINIMTKLLVMSTEAIDCLTLELSLGYLIFRQRFESM